jgi:hypothetical protein
MKKILASFVIAGLKAGSRSAASISPSWPMTSSIKRPWIEPKAELIGGQARPFDI